MPEKITAENLLNNIMDTFTEQHNAPKPKNISFFFEEAADVLLWRNKKISASVLTGATAIWVIFEWLNYHLLTMVFFSLLTGMLAQFAWSNASGTPSKVPRVRLPEELFANIGVSIGAEVNRFLGYLQNVACGGNLKQFLMNMISRCRTHEWFRPRSTSYVKHLQSYEPGSIPALNKNTNLEGE
ncbi:hypothetical protein IFM89_003404 [Coptis chinensis]|uniref:Reticulon-like protein n=1 Tax=Coptis chinensis TaxID=261450 RepID=A0A835GTV4_9MAGN|nr:hypothetical protein IFM89_003404 [Coptis chinensis]